MEPQAHPGDEVRRFIIENQPVRGHWVRLDGAWRELRAHTEYPQPVQELLGQAVAASVLLAATLKFRGQLTLQLQGNGAVSLLVAQCTHDFRLRAVAKYDEAGISEAATETSPRSVSAVGPGQRAAVNGIETLGAGKVAKRLRLGGTSLPDAGLFRKLVGSEGRFTVTIEADERGTRYQGIVPLMGTSLAESLEAYFESSEQLPTRVLLAADGDRGAGVLVQKLPGAKNADDSEMQEIWEDAQKGIERLSADELLRCPVEELLGRGFAAHDMRLFRGTPVQFQCRCNQGRVAGLLRALGAEEVRDILREEGAVIVTCEFCHRPYQFDSVDVEALFAEASPPGPGGSNSIH